MMQFGPHTQEFLLFLTQAENLTLKQTISMQDKITPETVEVYHQAYDKLCQENLSQSLLVKQMLNLYSDHYPEAILISALGIVSQHVLSEHEHHTLMRPWEKVMHPASELAAV